MRAEQSPPFWTVSPELQGVRHGWSAVEFIAEVPMTSMGKFAKKTFAGYELPGFQAERGACRA